MNRLNQVHWLARASLAFMFAYHGLVPKLIILSPGEQLLLQAHGLAHAALLLVQRLTWPLLVGAAVLLGLLVDVAVMQPSMLVDAFNPVSLNVAGMALCAVAWLSRQDAARKSPANIPSHC